MERKIGLFSTRARSKAASPQGCQSTGLWACCSRYGLFSCARRLVCSGKDLSISSYQQTTGKPGNTNAARSPSGASSEVQAASGHSLKPILSHEGEEF